MVVELISVGTELLLGNIVNTNTQFLAEKCALLGLTMYHQVTVGDNHDRLAEVIRTALKRSGCHHPDRRSWTDRGRSDQGGLCGGNGLPAGGG